MTKKLKIRFVKFEEALVMQILEQEGNFEGGSHIRTSYLPALSRDTIYLRGDESKSDLELGSLRFSSNAERNAHFAKVINWITDEHFTTGSSELKIGGMCEVSDAKEARGKKGRLLAILPENYENPYIVGFKTDDKNTCIWSSFRCARPIAQCVEPKVDDDVYTWEMEVADER